MKDINSANQINKAMQLFHKGEYQKVFVIAQKLFPKNQNNLDVLGLLIESARGLNDTKNEEKYLLKAVKISDNAIFFQALAVLYYKNGDFSKAKGYYEKAIELYPYYVDCYLYLSLIYTSEYEFERAEELILKAIKLTENTENVFECHHYLARLYIHMQKYEESYEIFKTLVELGKYDANLLFNFSLLCLDLRKYLDGFNLYRARYQEGRKDKLEFFTDLEILDKDIDIEGKNIFIVGEQGYGDCIQFIRYLPLFLEKKANVYATVPSLVRELFEKNYPQVQFVDTVVTKFDYQVPLCDAAYLFSTEYESIPYGEKYLSVDKKESLLIKEKHFQNSKKRKIGIVWRSNVHYEKGNELGLKSRNRGRWNIELKDFLKYFNQNDVELYSLQVAVTDEERKLLKESNIPSLGDDFVSFYDNALVIDNLDMVIAINTASAIVSAAMGVKTVIFLPDSSDWRWGIAGKTSNWYKSVRLVRRENREEWKSLIERTASYILQEDDDVNT